MSGIRHPSVRGSFTFASTVAGFLSCPGLPFVDILSETRIQRVFAKHHNLFGRTYSTAIVLWAFMSQVLRDGKEACCQSAIGRISSYLARHGLGDVDSDTRDYCRARAKLSEAAVRELSREIADESERLVEQEHLITALINQGVNVCFRKHQNRRTDFRTGKLGESPRHISFVSCCQYVLAAWDILVGGELVGAARRSYCTSRLDRSANV